VVVEVIVDVVVPASIAKEVGRREKSEPIDVNCGSVFNECKS
jgi:hypothetical protein